MATKQKPGEFDCYNEASDNEPVFTLRSTDPLAPQLVREWAYRYKSNNYPLDERQERKFKEALACADTMEVWRYNWQAMSKLKNIDVGV